MLVAAGTTPNITYEKECPGTFQLDAKRKFFQPHNAVDDGDGRFSDVSEASGITRASGTYALGVSTLLIRGFDPLADAVEYGRELIPLVRAEVARRDRDRAA